MLGAKKVVCIIPARLASTRFPEKMLQSLAGKPMLQWVWDAARSVDIFDECHFAIDDVKTAKLLDGFGASWHMTSVGAACGTDRLVELMERKIVNADIWVNWQGDEPFINATMIHDLLQSAGDSDVDIWTLKKLITCKEQIKSPGYAKVVADRAGNALYFSRSPIPYYRDIDLESGTFYKHVGIYAFTTKGLGMIPQMQPNSLEEAEKLEQLRFLEHGFKIRLHETLFDVKGIDTPEDLSFAEKLCTNKESLMCI
jgi:3-deoxy-manno-octulosonate cytidylyltransferase (CMP-KDO synthetase)